jgi:hypothetical protein
MDQEREAQERYDDEEDKESGGHIGIRLPGTVRLPWPRANINRLKGQKETRSQVQEQLTFRDIENASDALISYIQRVADEYLQLCGRVSRMSLPTGGVLE